MGTPPSPFLILRILVIEDFKYLFFFSSDRRKGGGGVGWGLNVGRKLV